MADMMHEEHKPVAMTSAQLRGVASQLAAEMKTAAVSPQGLPHELRLRFVNLRTALFQMGIFDPVLVRFDTATGTQASSSELATQLEKVAQGMRES